MNVAQNHIKETMIRNVNQHSIPKRTHWISNPLGQPFHPTFKQSRITTFIAIKSAFSCNPPPSNIVFGAKGLLDASSLPHKGREKICVHCILSEHHKWDYTRYVVVKQKRVRSIQVCTHFNIVNLAHKDRIRYAYILLSQTPLVELHYLCCCYWC